MSADTFERAAQQAARQAAQLEQLARRLDSLGRQTVDVIGGTDTGEDRRLLQNVAAASAAAKKSAAAYRDACDHARRAAAEAHRERTANSQRVRPRSVR